MRVSGFTFLQNVVRTGYPFRESLRSLLPLVDELVVVLPPSEDGTEDAVRALGDPRIRVLAVPAVELRGAAYYAHYTDLAYQACTGDWCIYLQADEVIPETSYPVIRDALRRFHDDPRMEGMALKYRHFYGSPRYFFHGYGWYPREVRILRHLPDIRAWKDAQGFRRNNRKLRVVLLDAWIHHYGWMLPPALMLRKLHQTEHVRGLRDTLPARTDPAPSAERVYGHPRGLHVYEAPHPAVMKTYLERCTWDYRPPLRPPTWRRRLQRWAADLSERLTGRRWFEYQNFHVVARYP